MKSDVCETDWNPIQEEVSYCIWTGCISVWTAPNISIEFDCPWHHSVRHKIQCTRPKSTNKGPTGNKIWPGQEYSSMARGNLSEGSIMWPCLNKARSYLDIYIKIGFEEESDWNQICLRSERILNITFFYRLIFFKWDVKSSFVISCQDEFSKWQEEQLSEKESPEMFVFWGW